MNNVAVVFCTWQRIEKLEQTLNNLLSQTYKTFDIFIWNNNSEEIKKINSIIRKYKNKIKVEVYHSDKNIGGIGRFHYSKRISSDYSKIIFIDDNQVLGNNVIKNMIEKHQSMSILSWWGWNINGNYWKRERVTDFSKVDYCGTGGMITDAVLFNNINLKSIPDEFSFVEDLWLSYVAKYEHGFKLIGGDFEIKIEVDGKDQYKGLKPIKNKLYNYLINKYE